jgi:hypothetical protein
MENIKKLGYTKEEYGDNYRSREVDTEIEDVIDKVNEIIDRLNGQPEEKALHLPMTSKDLKEARKELQEDTPEEWEKKDWKYRFRKLFYNSGYDYDIPLIEQEVLKDFISKELDKAREEEYEEGFEDGLQDVKKIEREK